MSFSYIRRYTGPVEAVIFDNAGTLVDFGSTAPVMAFIEIFRRRGVEADVCRYGTFGESGFRSLGGVL